MQKIYMTAAEGIENILSGTKTKKFMLVCDSSFEYLSIKNNFQDLSVPFVKFDEFTPNPDYSDVYKGVMKFNEEGCDTVIAVGGGSTIDVAKCIKLYSSMDADKCFLEQEYKENEVSLAAIPTTAGTGSESTRFAVIYYKGVKQSVTHLSIIPQYVILDSDVLKTLPVYQKKCTLLDALCQGIESWWSVNSTDESIEYSKKAVETILSNMDSYIIDNNYDAAKKIMIASNYAGRAINITQTTAAHAMSYKLTSLYGIPHGHAVSVCLPVVWGQMTENINNCIDKRGKNYLENVFNEISGLIGGKTIKEAINIFILLLEKLEIKYPESSDREKDIEVLVSSVNATRLSNNPVRFSENELKEMYERILK